MWDPDVPDPRTIPAEQGDERRVLVEFLEYYRSSLLMKAGGITDEQARAATCPPSDLNLMGLVRHMAEVERSWFRRRWRDEPVGPLYYGDASPSADPDGDIHVGEADTLEEAIRTWLAEVEIAREIVAAERTLDGVCPTPRADNPIVQPNLRWILVHMIEEYARHCGHADLIRQAIDGTVGD